MHKAHFGQTWVFWVWLGHVRLLNKLSNLHWNYDGIWYTKFLNSYFNCLITMMLPANFVLSKHWTHSKNSLDIDSIPWKHFYRPECQFLSLARYALCLLLTYILEIARNSLKRKN